MKSSFGIISSFRTRATTRDGGLLGRGGVATAYTSSRKHKFCGLCLSSFPASVCVCPYECVFIYVFAVLLLLFFQIFICSFFGFLLFVLFTLFLLLLLFKLPQ